MLRKTVGKRIKEMENWAKGGSGRVSEPGPMYFWVYFEGRAGGVSQMRKQPF